MGRADRAALRTAVVRGSFVILSGIVGCVAYGLTSKRSVTAWPVVDGAVMALTVLCLTGLVFLVTLQSRRQLHSERS